MDEAALKLAFEAERAALKAWGELIRDDVLGALGAQIAPDKRVDYFLRIWPVVPRVKETASFLTKALRRGKGYKNPLLDITDKVGIRFVTLLLSETRVVEKILTSNGKWTARKDRDFDEEIAAKPHHFDYQSLHYIVRPNQDLEHNGIPIPKGLACEVQIRTLLQHAYSELAHDTVYKPKSSIGEDTSDLSRKVARSMALIETSDLIFEQVSETILEANQALRKVIDSARVVYERHIARLAAVDYRFSDYVLSHYRDELPQLQETALEAFITQKAYLIDFIADRAQASGFYSHPLVIIICFLADADERELARRWPLEPSLLTEILTKLGISTDFL